VQDSALKGCGRRFGTVAGLQFAKNALNMEFRGVFRKAQQVADFLVAQPFDEESQNLGFAGSQI